MSHYVVAFFWIVHVRRPTWKYVQNELEDKFMSFYSSQIVGVGYIHKLWRCSESSWRCPRNFHIFKKIFPLVFFNILTEPLLVQKQTIHQHKALDLSYLEPEGQGRGMIRRGHTYLPQRTLGKKANLTEQIQDAKKKKFNAIFNILLLWANCMPINF